ncbi:MAG: energy transducer TonB [Leptolyngbya sp. RL_3_1]|nr:energy transducer TonB [Leptolyngbya sp. RL_3_1]
MALSQDCQQQHHRERTLSQRWIAVGAIGATGLHLGLLPLIGFDAEALVSRAEDEPIQIIVTSAEAEAVLSPEAALGEASPFAAAEPLAAATPPDRNWPEPESLPDEPAPEEELAPEEKLESEEEPEEDMAEEPEPEPAVAEEPEPDAMPDPEAETDLADTAETAGVETIEGGGKPEQIAKQPTAGEAPAATGGDAAPAVALAPAPEATDGAGETAPESTELGGLLDGYFPEGAEDGLLNSSGQEELARRTGPGDRGNATEDSRGNGEGRGSRTVRCRSCARPSYPADALADGVEGEAKVSVQFDANGNVIGVTLERSSGNPELDRAALASAQQWQFDSGGQSGSVSVEIPFVIEGSDRHQEAQRQGDRESATLPDPDPTATGENSRRETASSPGEAPADSPSAANSEGLTNRDPESGDSTAHSDAPEETAPETLTGEGAAEEGDETLHNGESDEAESTAPAPTAGTAESTSEAPSTAKPAAPAASPPAPTAPQPAAPTVPPPAAPTEAAPPVTPTPEE